MIYLDDNFRIKTGDIRNIILEQRVEVEKKGKKELQWRFGGYYSNIKNLLNSYLHKSLNTTNSETIEELLSEIKRIEEVIDKKAEVVGNRIKEYIKTEEE